MSYSLGIYLVLLFMGVHNNYIVLFPCIEIAIEISKFQTSPGTKPVNRSPTRMSEEGVAILNSQAAWHGGTHTRSSILVCSSRPESFKMELLALIVTFWQVTEQQTNGMAFWEWIYLYPPAQARQIWEWLLLKQQKTLGWKFSFGLKKKTTKSK